MRTTHESESPTHVSMITKTRSFGPVVRKLRRRLTLAWLTMCLVGVLPKSSGSNRNALTNIGGTHGMLRCGRVFDLPRSCADT